MADSIIIDDLASEFEAAWPIGRIEDFLAKVPPSLEAALLEELLKVEVELVWKQGKEPQWDDYRQRFPKHKDLIENLSVLTVPPMVLSPVDAPSHDPAPLRFSDYVLEEELGRGGMGIVFRARQKSLPRPVAVKTLLNQDSESKKRFHREACAIASLGSHPNIVPVHGFGTIPQGTYDFGHIGEDTYFLAMEFIKGSDLAKLVRPEGIPVDRAVQILVAIADAIQHAHNHGIWHRDLKPNNVLIDEAGRVLVTDFGLAKVVGGTADFQSVPGQIVGTPNSLLSG